MNKCCVCKTNEVPPFAEVHNGVGYDVDFSSGDVCEICDSLIRVFDDFRLYASEIGTQLKSYTIREWDDDWYGLASFLVNKNVNLTDLEIYSIYDSSDFRYALSQCLSFTQNMADSLQALHTYSYFPSDELLSHRTFADYDE